MPIKAALRRAGDDLAIISRTGSIGESLAAAIIQEEAYVLLRQ